MCDDQFILQTLNYILMDTLDPDLLVGMISAYLGLVAVIALFAIIVGWKVFTKAGQPGWAVLVPIYNLYVYTQIVKRPGWWILLYFASVIPVVGSLAVLVVSIMDTIRLAKVFGKGTGFGVGLLLLGVIFYPILAFGDSNYDESQLA